MRVNSTRPAAVAGTWYPAAPGALTRDVDGYLAAAGYDVFSVDMTGSPLSTVSRTSPSVIQAAGRPVRLVRPG